MSAISVKEDIQEQDITLKIFEEILKEKLDLIFKENSFYHPSIEYGENPSRAFTEINNKF